jgi:hypothetical protein
MIVMVGCPYPRGQGKLRFCVTGFVCRAGETRNRLTAAGVQCNPQSVSRSPGQMPTKICLGRFKHKFEYACPGLVFRT